EPCEYVSAELVAISTIEDVRPDPDERSLGVQAEYEDLWAAAGGNVWREQHSLLEMVDGLLERHRGRKLNVPFTRRVARCLVSADDVHCGDPTVAEEVLGLIEAADDDTAKTEMCDT